MADFTGIENWVFDLDNTLYPAECHLFAQIDVRMTDFVARRLGLPKDKARILQKHYYGVYGTTLAGLMKEHGIKPKDFLDYVHDIDLTNINPCKELYVGIERLPGRRFIFTNGSVRHAENVAGKLGILDLFEGIFDIAQCDYIPKPERQSYEKFASHFNFDPQQAAMFEDLPQNLIAPHEMGQTTILVHSKAEWFADEPESKRPAGPGEKFAHVDHMTDDLTGFLQTLVIDKKDDRKAAS